MKKKLIVPGREGISGILANTIIGIKIIATVSYFFKRIFTEQTVENNKYD